MIAKNWGLLLKKSLEGAKVFIFLKFTQPQLQIVPG